MEVRIFDTAIQYEEFMDLYGVTVVSLVVFQDQLVLTYKGRLAE